MIEIFDSAELNLALSSLDDSRSLLENALQTKKTFFMYCDYCGGVKQMQVSMANDSWTDLRGQFICDSCGLSNRDRLFYKCISRSIHDVSSKGLIFEKSTLMYKRLEARLEKLTGVEFGGYEIEPGALFETNQGVFEHQDMQNMSYPDNTFDYVLHSDVLEHIPDPFKALSEIKRVLKPNGVCLFSTPIYSNTFIHKKTAVMVDGKVQFTGPEMYHGDPIREEGVPVFYLFGLNLLEDVVALGLSGSYLLEHSLVNGIFSNNNPYINVGHMWPIVVKMVKH
ncbi:MAG: SAM-dependent methyltransferase [Candidatus Azotimanducaceae bacterium]|jgi:SAM-dependent methyltransferase